MNTREIFENIEYVENYQNNRWVSVDTFNKYVSEIVKVLPEHKLNNGVKILDIGCGTGQFAIRLTEHPNLFVIGVDAIDSSKNKYELLRQNIQDKTIVNIRPHWIDIFDYATTEKYDVIICSEMIHLVNDVKEFFQKVASLLSDNGVIFVRTSTYKQLYQRKWYEDFPLCRYIDICRHKDNWLIKVCSDLVNFSSFTEIEIDESCTMDKTKYIRMFEKRSFSTLRLLTDDEYRKGMLLLKAKHENEVSIYFDYKMTCYIMKK